MTVLRSRSGKMYVLDMEIITKNEGKIACLCNEKDIIAVKVLYFCDLAYLLNFKSSKHKLLDLIGVLEQSFDKNIIYEVISQNNL